MKIFTQCQFGKVQLGIQDSNPSLWRAKSPKASQAPNYLLSIGSTFTSGNIMMEKSMILIIQSYYRLIRGQLESLYPQVWEVKNIKSVVFNCLISSAEPDSQCLDYQWPLTPCDQHICPWVEGRPGQRVKVQNSTISRNLQGLGNVKKDHTLHPLSSFAYLKW